MICSVENPLLHRPAQTFIDRHLKDDLSSLILKGSPVPDVSIQEIAQQIEGKRKAEKKLPTWFKTKNILYPKKQNLSQTSSETTAKYKASLVSGERLIDLTGGFGIDSFFFSQTMDHVTHCELNSDLSSMAEHNFIQLGKRNNIQFLCGNGVQLLQETDQNFDWIYLDPSRRSDTGNKVFRLEDCQPDMTEILPILFEKGKKILLKTSPLLDLSLGISLLKNVVEIHIIAVSNDVKEVLWILSPEPHLDKTIIKTINFKGQKKEMFQGAFEEEQNQIPSCSEPLQYLYEPNAAVMKSGLFNTLATQTTIEKLHPNTHLYTSDKQIVFPGRTFKILKKFPFKPNILKREIAFAKANIAIRNFPLSVAQLRKQLKFKDGGDHYLFFTTDLDHQKIVLICEKIKPVSQ